MDSMTVTPVELFFLGKLMDAKYIDYSYITAMPDIQLQYDIQEQQTLSTLEKKGWGEVDFSGETEVDEAVVELLEPVFFGETESRLTADRFRNFHVLGNRITMAEPDGAAVTFSAVSDEEILALLNGCDVTIDRTNVHAGSQRRSFTVRELMAEKTRREAAAFIKGE